MDSLACRRRLIITILNVNLVLGVVEMNSGEIEWSATQNCSTWKRWVEWEVFERENILEATANGYDKTVSERRCRDLQVIRFAFPRKSSSKKIPKNGGAENMALQICRLSSLFARQWIVRYDKCKCRKVGWWQPWICIFISSQIRILFRFDHIGSAVWPLSVSYFKQPKKVK